MSRAIRIVSAVLALLAGGCTATKTPVTEERIAIRVTEDGFQPAIVRVAGRGPITLAVTRETDKTCATEFAIAEAGVRRELPLNHTVEITFTPRHAGEIRFACGMDMISGTLLVP